MKNKIKVISVVGPTASGKTGLSVELAKLLDGEIISADSMQIYKGMDIATAKPDDAEMQGVPHHLMGFLPPEQTYSVAMFTDDARCLIADITKRNKLPFIVGGTGLYVDALLNNIRFHDEERNEEVSTELRERIQKEGIEPLLEELLQVDPDSAQRLSKERNPKRIIRALEFYKTTGKTITEQLALSRTEESPYKAIKIGLSFSDREKLYDRINKRVDDMLSRGLLEEARQVLSSPLSQTSAMAIGYKELAPYISGEASLDDCVEKLKRETRRYAKRQLTWFRRDKEINWLYVDEYNSFDELFDAAVQIINKG